MTSHSEIIVRKFLNICDWLFQTYQMRKYLFDENPDVNLLQSPRHAHFFYRIQEITQESWLHQLAKLHDKAAQGGNVNLSIEYIIEFGGWGESTLNNLLSLKEKMLVLSEPIKKARNKLLSHNDLEAITRSGSSYGEFNPGEGEIYFNALEGFCSIVSHTALNEPFLYDDLVKNDVYAFMSQFKRGEISKSIKVTNNITRHRSPNE